MNKKMQFLIEESLKKKFKSKSFIISNIVIVLCLILLCNIDTIIKVFGGDFGNDINIYVVDNDNIMYEDFEQMMKGTYLSILETDNYVISKTDKEVEELKTEIIEEEKEDIIINVEKDKNVFNASIISYEYVDAIFYNNLVNALNLTKYNIALENSSISEDELDFINKEITVNRLILNEELNEEEEAIKTITEVIVPILTLPFFMLTVMLVSMIGAEINEEKTSKSMEIIISSVSPKIHFASKIITVNIFVIIQSLLLILSAFVGVLSRLIISGVPDVSSVTSSLPVDSTTMNYIDIFLKSDIFKTILDSIPYIIVIFLLSFLAYSLLSGILASITTSIEDYQQLQTPLQIFMVVAYYIAMFSFMYESSVFIKVISYLPLVSAIVAPPLILLGEYTIIDLIIAIVLLVLTNFVFIKYGSRIYKVGILNYSSSNLWKKMWKSLKEQ